MTRADDLDILGLGAEADDAAIRAAYRAQALHHHPDLGGDAAVMATISDAYQRLLDPAPPAPGSPGARSASAASMHIDPDDLPDDFTIGHSMLAFVVVPVILAIILLIGVFSVLSTIL